MNDEEFISRAATFSIVAGILLTFLGGVILLGSLTG